MSMKKKYVDILLIAVAVLLNACSSDDSGAQTGVVYLPPCGKGIVSPCRTFRLL